MNQITSTLIAAVFGGFFSVVPSTIYAPSAAHDSMSQTQIESNFNPAATLDTTQVIEAATPELVCFDAANEYGALSCYEPENVPAGTYDQYEVVWVGTKADYAQHLAHN